MRALMFPLLVALASCTTPTNELANEEPADQSAPPASLAGSWAVSLLDGEKEGEALNFSADGETIWWEPACAGARRAYSISGDRIAFSQSATGGGEPASAGGTMICLVAQPPELRAFMEAIEGVDTVHSAPAGAIRLHGDGMVLLMTPREDRPAPEAGHPASIVGEWRVGGIDGKPLDLPVGLTVSIGADRIEYADAPCGGYAWSYAYDEGGLTLQPLREPDPACLASATAPREVFEVAVRIGEALGVARTAANGIELSGGEGSVTLFSQ